MRISILLFSALVVFGSWVATPVLANVPGLVSYADLVEKLSPAVVNISSKTKPKKVQADVFGGMRGDNPFAGTPFEQFFQQFNDQMQQGFGDAMTLPQQSLGTGLVMSADGYVITNNHVVAGADEIVVKFNNNRHEFPARVVGRDEKTDLALLKISADKPLPAAELGDSDAVRVGDAVLAIGNPFGLGGTVTSGIVSALGRNIGQGPYDDFIQTDAAINPGNSGGPLFSADGKMIGINSVIFTRSGASNGIGFAIPVNTVKTVVAQLKANGKVVRGWLGVKVQLLTPDLAQGLGLQDDVGALVAEVTPRSPAALAGVKTGDVIVSFNGKAIRKMDDLPKLVAATSLNSRVPLNVVRNGKPLALQVKVSAMPEDEQAPAKQATRDGDGEDMDAATQPGKIGLMLQGMSAQVRASLQIPKEVNGPVVVRVSPDGAAAAAGLQRGDVLVEADWQPVRNVQDLRAAMQRKAGKTLLLRVWRSGEASDGYLFVSLKMPAA